MATWTSKVDYTDKILAADWNALQTLKADIQKKTVANMGVLDEGELGLETDTRRVLIGSSMGNQVIKGDYITPEMYGENTIPGTTDMTAAIQAAINAILAVGGGQLFLPGKYKITSKIVINCGGGKHISFLGAGKETTTIRWAGAANETMIEWNNTAGSKMWDLLIDGDDIAGIGLLIDGAVIASQSNHFLNIQIQKVTGTPGRGLQVGVNGGGEYGPTANAFDNIWLWKNKTGLYQDNGQTVDNAYNQFYCSQNTEYGFYAARGGIWAKHLASIDSGIADLYFSPDCLWISLDDVEIENTGGISAIFATGARTWPTTLRNFRVTQGTAGIDVFRFLQGGQLTLDTCRFDGAGGAANNVVITSPGGLTTSLVRINSSVTGNATWSLTGVQDLSFGDGTVTQAGPGSEFVSDTQYRIDRSGSGYARLGFYNSGTLRAAVGEDAGDLGNIKLYANPGAGLVEVLKISGAGDATLIGSMNVATGKVYKINAVQVVGAQAAAQADLKADYTTGDLDSEAEIIAALNASNAAFNTLLAKQRTHGLIAT